MIGELARVVVHTDPRTGKVKHASAHDLRRSFGNRWAKRVMPAVLQRLMRHESIETRMGYYVDLDADELAEDLYRADQKREKEIVARFLIIHKRKRGWANDWAFGPRNQRQATWPRPVCWRSLTAITAIGMTFLDNPGGTSGFPPALRALPNGNK